MTGPVDPHAPTYAAPTPEPTPVVGTADASPGHPPGSARPEGGAVAMEDPHPEKKVGMAFAGGLGAAIVLKLLARRRHR